MTVVCTIMVVALHFQSQADVKGKVIASNSHKYLVDFSADAKARDFDGDYSSKLVSKSDCVETK